MRQTKLERLQIKQMIDEAEACAIKRGLISSTVEHDEGWTLSLWDTGVLILKCDLSHKGNCVNRTFDKEGATTNLTTSTPAAAVWAAAGAFSYMERADRVDY